jgi:hypothetical protein
MRRGFTPAASGGSKPEIKLQRNIKVSKTVRLLGVTVKTSAILLLVGVSLLPSRVLATDVSGEQWGTWTKQNSPYNVIGEVRIPPESTLVIEPGVIINFQGYYRFIVDTSATILAMGTETDSIYFTAEDTVTGWHGIRFVFSSSNSQLSYCQIEYGNATGPGHEYQGGGMFIDRCSPTIMNSTIWKNWADGAGGGIYSYESNPTIIGNFINSNACIRSGAGIYICRGDSSTVIGNIVTENSCPWGGGVFCRASRSLISDNIITNNYAVNGGGVLFVSPGRPILQNNIIAENSVVQRGGGIKCGDQSRPIIRANLIINNSTDLGEEGRGGAIFCEITRPFIINNTITGNSAKYGGGIYAREYAHLILVNNILWGDTSEVGSEINLRNINSDPCTVTVAYCDVQGGESGVYVEPGCVLNWGEGNLDSDPIFRDPPADDFHLMADYCGDPLNSPCIDAGHPDSLDILLDCFHGLGSDRADMGAYGGRNSGWPTGIEEDENGLLIPKQFLLRQNYPNPFNANTTISYLLPNRCEVKLEIYNILGEKVATLLEARQQPGLHAVVWEASELSSGLYLYKLTVGDLVATRRMVLIK